MKMVLLYSQMESFAVLVPVLRKAAIKPEIIIRGSMSPFIRGASNSFLACPASMLAFYKYIRVSRKKLSRE